VVLCVGETRVELVCRRPQADAFVPSLGGSVARVALAAARLRASVALAGAVGADEWGRWLRARLAAAGVDVSRLELREGAQTPLEVVSVAGTSRYGEAVDGSWPLSLSGASGLFITLSGPWEREVVEGARAVALEHGLPVVFAPDLAAQRWRSQADAAASANACVPGALLVCVSASGAAVLTGEDDPERAAVALVKAGARMVAISLGAAGAILRGELRGQVSAEVSSEDEFTGVLLARLALSGFYAPVVAASLAEAARGC
jgi:fructokinase